MTPEAIMGAIVDAILPPSKPRRTFCDLCGEQAKHFLYFKKFFVCLDCLAAMNAQHAACSGEGRVICDGEELKVTVFGEHVSEPPPP